MTKTCKKCTVEKPIGQFLFRRDTQRYRPECKTCSQRVSREGHLKRKYGISAQEYEDILAAQDYSCAICHSPFDQNVAAYQTTNRQKLAVDHNHETGEVRGLLCYECNIGLGKFRDDPQLVARALEYLDA